MAYEFGKCDKPNLVKPVEVGLEAPIVLDAVMDAVVTVANVVEAVKNKGLTLPRNCIRGEGTNQHLEDIESSRHC